MKLSAYHKMIGNNVTLKLDYENIEQYDLVYISKVFMETEIPFEPKDKSLKTEDTIGEFYKDNQLLLMPNVRHGGTGFYYDKAPPLPYEIEHIMPDYHLYDEWVATKLSEGQKKKNFTYYIDYSIGFTTRGCIRRCGFCVNRNHTMCETHSPTDEFVDKERKYVCLLDDNVFACKDWKLVFEQLNTTGKRFQFKQGLDERFLTDEKCEVLFSSNWVGDYIFAFDNIKDKDIIEEKLRLIRKYTHKKIRFYTFCGYNHLDESDLSEEFWVKDILELFERIKILMKYECYPYVMRHRNCNSSPYRGIYINIASWCNQPHLFTKLSYREIGIKDSERKGGESSTERYNREFEMRYPKIANRYFDIKMTDVALKETSETT